MPFLRQLALDFAEPFGTDRIEVQHGDLLKQITNQSQQPGWTRVLVRTRVQLRQDHR